MPAARSQLFLLAIPAGFHGERLVRAGTRDQFRVGTSPFTNRCSRTTPPSCLEARLDPLPARGLPFLVDCKATMTVLSGNTAAGFVYSPSRWATQADFFVHAIRPERAFTEYGITPAFMRLFDFEQAAVASCAEIDGTPGVTERVNHARLVVADDQFTACLANEVICKPGVASFVPDGLVPSCFMAQMRPVE